MDAGLALQYVIVGLIVLISAWVVLKKQFPGTVRKWRGALALWLLRPGHPAWMRVWGRKVAPPASGGGGACGGCDSCGPSTPKKH